MSGFPLIYLKKREHFQAEKNAILTQHRDELSKIQKQHAEDLAREDESRTSPVMAPCCGHRCREVNAAILRHGVIVRIPGTERVIPGRESLSNWCAAILGHRLLERVLATESLVLGGSSFPSLYTAILEHSGPERLGTTERVVFESSDPRSLCAAILKHGGLSRMTAAERVVFGRSDLQGF